MILVAYQRTMANAKRIVPDTGLQMRKARVVEALPAPRVVLIEARSRPSQHARTPLQRVIDLVARMHGVPYAAVMSHSRRREVSLARMAAICAVYQAFPDMTLYRLGQRFDRDHSTISHALNVRGMAYHTLWPLDRRSPQPGDGT